MSDRTVNIGKQDPACYNALSALNDQAVQAAAHAGLDPRLVELVKIRASQLNGCAFCLRLHTNDAIKVGETADRLAVLVAWWESQYFSDVERAALALVERITLIADHGPDAGHGVIPEDVLDESQIAAVIWLTIVINSWNRVAISSHYPVAPSDRTPT